MNLHATSMRDELSPTVFFNRNLKYYLYLSRSSEASKTLTSEVIALQQWLSENVSGGYSIGPAYVSFEEYDDALLCYLRFKG